MSVEPFQQDRAAWDIDLIRRYNVPGPRYTSYPTANVFDERFSGDDYLALADHPRERSSIAPLSLYVHIPFCRRACHYCACNKLVTRKRSLVIDYLDAVATELAMRGALHGQRPVTQLHWGGGTPTYLDEAELTELMHHIASHFRTTRQESREYSIEIDPRTVQEDTIALLRGLGFNRISMGIQDFDPQVQAVINRTQSPELVGRLVECVRKHRFKSLSFDLIYGLPCQNRRSFGHTVAEVIALAPDRISLYNYAHLPDSFRNQRAINASSLPGAEEKLAILDDAGHALLRAGYVYIGMDHFVRPDDELSLARERGRLQRNFQGYSTCLSDDLIGVGPSSISLFAGSFSQNCRDLDGWVRQLQDKRLPIERGWRMDTEDLLRRDIIMSLACQLTLDIAQLEATHRIDFHGRFQPQLAQLKALAADGLLTLSRDRIEITGQGRLLLRNICMVFDEYLQDDRQPRFSRTI